MNHEEHEEHEVISSHDLSSFVFFVSFVVRRGSEECF